ncbi:hypothetical protein BXY57_0268 [Thermoflavifilum aggregans]|uniref:DUF4149 domain-containing protein n=1 Tax=Thermoflavifilum aggregans TaxID=454188 RepID=A0A2M9CRY2_9BACT|nr:hypothetical protein [Thermoflavifilum aggregans]PJJ74706.1 hypothetical protein BXY57_0268 [Thermoflavifilum aggregans]
MLRTVPGEWIALAACFLWIGMVVAISFMEAWLKFRAPGVTKAVGLSIGKRVFTALNRTEWVCAVILTAGVLLLPDRLHLMTAVCFAGAVFILLIQTIFWLPVLKIQADALIEGKNYSGKSIHINYLIGEIIKIIALFTAAILLGLQNFS